MQSVTLLCVAIVQIRNVPIDVHARLKEQAAAAGLSLSDYLRGHLERLASERTWAQVAAEIRAAGPVSYTGPSSAELIREAREDAGRGE